MCNITIDTSSNFYNGKNHTVDGLEREFRFLNFLNMVNVNYEKIKFIKYECINNHFTLYN